MRLIIIRHGETEWNSNKKIQGVTDIELSRNGIYQAKKLAQRIKRFPVIAVFTSPLKRARQTADKIAEAFGLQTVIDENLREYCFGEWEGQTFERLSETFPKELDVWNTRPQDCVIPGAETFETVEARCEAFVGHILNNYPHSGIVVAVTHSLPLKMIVAKSIGLDLKNVHSLRTDNASLTIIDYYPERSVLKLFNDTTHIYE